MKPPVPMQQLSHCLKELDGQSFERYQKLAGKSYHHQDYRVRFAHIQGSPGAFPASVCRLSLKTADLGLPAACFVNDVRMMAAADYLLRVFGNAVQRHARRNRGAQGSGSFQPLVLPPQVLKRNVIAFRPPEVDIAFRISLPGSGENRILGGQAAQMFQLELPAIVQDLKASVACNGPLKNHCDVVEDMVDLQQRLGQYGLAAFIGDGAVLPRRSGLSQAPMQEGAVRFQAPADMAVQVVLPNAGRVRGLGIRPGVNVVIGGGFHGKSTLLDALAKGVYPHIAGDGREQVVTHGEAFFISAEEGRAVNGLDISPFIGDLPGGQDPQWFCTRNASGSTSEAAAIIEAVLAGARLLLIDEDSSATNFLIKDHHMRRLLPEDPITPLFDRVQELYRSCGVSTLIVVGGSSDYLGVAEHVIAMRNYKPVSMTGHVRRLGLPKPPTPAKPLSISEKRCVRPGNFNPVYHVRRLGKTIPVRIKPLRRHEKLLEYGNTQIDLTQLAALVDPHQVLTLGHALLTAGSRFDQSMLSPSALARALSALIDNEGLESLDSGGSAPLFLASARRLELAAAINRLRNLKVVKADR